MDAESEFVVFFLHYFFFSIIFGLGNTFTRCSALMTEGAIFFSIPVINRIIEAGCRNMDVTVH